MRSPVFPSVAVALALALAAVPASAGAATSPQSSIRYAWSQQLIRAGGGDTTACRYMTEDYQKQFTIGARSSADCPAAIRGRYADQRKRLGRAAVARQTRAEGAAARRARITVTGGSARGRLRVTVGDCTRTQSQRFERVDGRWLVDVVTANTATLSCLR